MRVKDLPLPGDFVVRRSVERSGTHPIEVFTVTIWPDADRIIGGPYQSAWYAVRQARKLLKDRSEHVWRDHADCNAPEQLEDVTHDGWLSAEKLSRHPRQTR
jgi:hypothetical protein